MNKDLLWSFFETTGDMNIYLDYKKCIQEESQISNQLKKEEQSD